MLILYYGGQQSGKECDQHPPPASVTLQPVKQIKRSDSQHEGNYFECCICILLVKSMVLLQVNFCKLAAERGHHAPSASELSERKTWLSSQLFWLIIGTDSDWEQRRGSTFTPDGPYLLFQSWTCSGTWRPTTRRVEQPPKAPACWAASAAPPATTMKRRPSSLYPECSWTSSPFTCKIPMSRLWQVGWMWNINQH